MGRAVKAYNLQRKGNGNEIKKDTEKEFSQKKKLISNRHVILEESFLLSSIVLVLKKILSE
jgi:hypothetical protein